MTQTTGYGQSVAQNTATSSTTRQSWLKDLHELKAPMAHHGSIQRLWEEKWRFPCSKSLYPFHDGDYGDFAPVFEALIEAKVKDGDDSRYTTWLMNAAQALIEQTEKNGMTQADDPKSVRGISSDIYLRACALLRIARFPYISRWTSEMKDLKWQAWELQKETYMKAAKLWDASMTEIMVPHRTRHAIHPTATTTDGGGLIKEQDSIPIYLRLPPTRAEHRLRPVVILMTGLDGYRPDNTVRSDEFIKRGWVTIIAEIPGTADCPADPTNPDDADLMWTNLLQWVQDKSTEYMLDMNKIMVWGLSAGGYYAVRIGHTHSGRLLGVVAQGAGVHWMFDSAWIENADDQEYPFDLSPCMAKKHGYTSVEEYKRDSQKKFSLLENGILDLQSCRMLLINGTSDGLMPIEDSMLLMEHGSPKEARFIPGALHMGYPSANNYVYPWMESVMQTG